MTDPAAAAPLTTNMVSGGFHVQRQPNHHCSGSDIATRLLTTRRAPGKTRRLNGRPGKGSPSTFTGHSVSTSGMSLRATALMKIIRSSWMCSGNFEQICTRLGKLMSGTATTSMQPSFKWQSGALLVSVLRAPTARKGPWISVQMVSSSTPSNDEAILSVVAVARSSPLTRTLSFCSWCLASPAAASGGPTLVPPRINANAAWALFRRNDSRAGDLAAAVLAFSETPSPAAVSRLIGSSPLVPCWASLVVVSSAPRCSTRASMQTAQPARQGCVLLFDTGATKSRARKAFKLTTCRRTLTA
mmetsp:Transcript_52088/g.122087  ORF Transcript_52088/g.122087 Transcript_52088/m.122087 type:complete len:301 (-) Transcript_52088:629-1531(-)